jgi:hypothetical protein
VAPAFIEFAEDGSSGSFGFIAVQGEMDCREVERDGRPGVEFSWEGNDECDPASGRGWAVLEEDGSLCGRMGWGDIPDQYGRRWDGDDGSSPMPKTPTGWLTSRQSCPGGDPGGHGQPRHPLTAARSATAT